MTTMPFFTARQCEHLPELWEVITPDGERVASCDHEDFAESSMTKLAKELNDTLRFWNGAYGTVIAF